MEKNARAAAIRRLADIHKALTCVNDCAGLSPRAAATAEALISDKDLAGAEDAADRIAALVPTYHHRLALLAPGQPVVERVDRFAAEFAAALDRAARNLGAGSLEALAAAAERAMAAHMAGSGPNSPRTANMRQGIVDALASVMAAAAAIPRAKPGPKSAAEAMRAGLAALIAEGWRPGSSAPLKEAHAAVRKRLRVAEPPPRGWGLDTFGRRCGDLLPK